MAVVRAGRKVGRRQRPQDAALRDAEVTTRRRRRRRARHLGKRRHTLDSRARRRRRSGLRTINGERRDAQRRHRRVQAGDDQAGKPTLEPAWSSRDLGITARPHRCQRHGVAASSGEYRGTGGRLTAARARNDRCPPCCICSTGSPARNCGAAADGDVVRARGPVRRQRPGLSRDLRQPAALSVRDSDGH